MFILQPPHINLKVMSFTTPPLFSRLEGTFYEVMSVDFEIDNFISLKSTQTIQWQIEYPATGLQAEVLSHIYISQRDIRGIVPLAEVRLVKCALSGSSSGNMVQCCGTLYKS